MAQNTNDTYVSPLLRRTKDDEVLSLATLAKYVPDAQAALKAQETLRETPEGALTPAEVQELRKTILAGEYAKERLVLIAMPLIKSLARKEHRRRQAWNSRVSLDDIISEGLSGLMRGIRAYNPEGNHSSPTNYLGQWITTDMRRNVESLEHDFSIPFEAMERQRKIRAIRSRLTAELNRDPTDEEIIEAVSDARYTGDSMMGRVIKKPQTESARRRVITPKHIEEERAMFARTGVMRTTVSREDGDDQAVAEEANAQNAIYGDEPHRVERTGTAEEIDNQDANHALSRLLEDAFVVLGVGRVQQDIIRRRFALVPYEEEQTIKDVTVHTGIPKHKVNRILTAFAAEMARVGGGFHMLVSRYDPEDLIAMGIGWAASALGEFTPPHTGTQNRDLQDSLVVKQETAQGRRILPTASGKGFSAVYLCSYDNLEMERMFQDEATADKYRRLPCSFCGKTTTRIS